jgi:hypothetical protein
MWGGGWGDHVPETARTVAKAFYAGRTCKRGNCETDGSVYRLENTVIARRIKPEDIPAHVARKLEGYLDTRRELEFTWSGWPTKMTARHLCALGVDAQCYGIKKPSARFNNVEVEYDRWYTPDEITKLRPPPIVPKSVRRDTGFVNLTLPLFA